MKYILIFFCLGCTKIDRDMIRPAEPGQTTQQNAARSSSAFPTYITLGPDTTLFYTNMIKFPNYSAYLNQCDLNQQGGVEVYQISGPTTAIISWYNYDYMSYPSAQNITAGKYGFVGHAWVTGYGYCDDSVHNDQVYDTCWVTVLKRRKKVKP